MCLAINPKDSKRTWWVTSFASGVCSLALCNSCVRSWFQGIDAVCSQCTINRLRNNNQIDMYRIMCNQLSIERAIPIHPMKSRWCLCALNRVCVCRYFCILCWNTACRNEMQFCSGFALIGVKSGIHRYAGMCRKCCIFLGSFVPNSIAALDTLENVFNDDQLHNVDWHFDLFGIILPTVQNLVPQLVTDRIPDVVTKSTYYCMSKMC
jgi:hypothetical protein